MKKILIPVTLILLISCGFTKETTVKVPKWKKEKKASKRQIKIYTKNFVNHLFDSTRIKDTSEIYNVIEN